MKIEGYFTRPRGHETAEEKFEGAKAELIGVIEEELNSIKNMDFETWRAAFNSRYPCNKIGS